MRIKLLLLSADMHLWRNSKHVNHIKADYFVIYAFEVGLTLDNFLVGSTS